MTERHVVDEDRKTMARTTYETKCEDYSQLRVPLSLNEVCVGGLTQVARCLRTLTGAGRGNNARNWRRKSLRRGVICVRDAALTAMPWTGRGSRCAGGDDWLFQNLGPQQATMG